MKCKIGDLLTLSKPDTYFITKYSLDNITGSTISTKLKNWNTYAENKTLFMYLGGGPIQGSSGIRQVPVIIFNKEYFDYVNIPEELACVEDRIIDIRKMSRDIFANVLGNLYIKEPGVLTAHHIRKLSSPKETINIIRKYSPVQKFITDRKEVLRGLLLNTYIPELNYIDYNRIRIVRNHLRCYCEYHTDIDTIINRTNKNLEYTCPNCGLKYYVETKKATARLITKSGRVMVKFDVHEPPIYEEEEQEMLEE